MQVIISHLNLDFDGLASMVAAGKLYPKAKKVLPERLSLSVQHFLALYKDSIQCYTPQQIDWHRVEEVILVDTSRLDRVGYFREHLSDVTWTIYDHHQGNMDDFNNVTYAQIENVGATITLLIEIIEKEGILVSAFEATIMALGLYADTGNFAYINTTSRDLKAASYLLDRGANLGIVSRFSERPLLGAQQSLFNTLMLNSTEYNIKGIDVILATTRQKEYQGGLSLIASKILEITGVHALIIVAEMVNKMYIVARSNTEMLDVYSIAAKFGGGGHSKAASANIKNGNYYKILDEVKLLLPKALKTSIVAKNIMSSPVKTVSPDTKIEEAAKIMLRYGHTGLPIVKDNQLFGIISRRDVDKGIHHGLGHAPVKGFMSKDVFTIREDTSLEEIQNLMIEEDVGRLPVIEEERLVGIVSRTDVLNYLHGENIKGDRQSAELPVPFEKNVKELIEDNISVTLFSVLNYIVEKAEAQGQKIYLVGGIVRDLLLGLPSEDIDIVVDGDAIAFAASLAEKWGGRVTSHQKFGTAKWLLPDGLKIDLTAARREYYDYPAALPTVERSNLKEDLYRRDFTINAMAVSLSRDKYGHLVDFFHGYKDLREGKIRILYNMSFIEDPTRMLRAIRFELRFGFSMGKNTLELAQNSVELIASVSKPRLAHELKSIFCETNPFHAFRRMNDLNLLQYLIGERPQEEIFSYVMEYCKLTQAYYKGQPNWISYYALLFYEKTNWLKHLDGYALNNMDRKVLYDLDRAHALWKDEKFVQKAWSLGQLHGVLKNICTEAILFMVTMEANCYNNEAALRYLTKRNTMAIPIQGADLKALGIKPGPIYKKILSEMEVAYFDEQFKSKEEAIKWLIKHYETLRKKDCPEKRSR